MTQYLVKACTDLEDAQMIELVAALCVAQRDETTISYQLDSVPCQIDGRSSTIPSSLIKEMDFWMGNLSAPEQIDFLKSMIIPMLEKLEESLGNSQGGA
jgi:hypothetical protein